MTRSDPGGDESERRHAVRNSQPISHPSGLQSFSAGWVPGRAREADDWDELHNSESSQHRVHSAPENSGNLLKKSLLLSLSRHCLALLNMAESFSLCEVLWF